MTTRCLYHIGLLAFHGNFVMRDLNKVAVLNGGLVKWLEEGRPTTSETNVYPKGNFVDVKT